MLILLACRATQLLQLVTTTMTAPNSASLAAPATTPST